MANASRLKATLTELLDAATGYAGSVHARRSATAMQADTFAAKRAAEREATARLLRAAIAYHLAEGSP